VPLIGLNLQPGINFEILDHGGNVIYGSRNPGSLMGGKVVVFLADCRFYTLSFGKTLEVLEAGSGDRFNQPGQDRRGGAV